VNREIIESIPHIPGDIALGIYACTRRSQVKSVVP
jgi:hypothetical protein